MALDYKIIGERIKRARLDNGLTQEQLAEKIEVSVAFLSRLETGSTHINLKRLNQICEVLNISEGFVLNGSNDQSRSYLTTDFSELLKNCPAEKLKLIYKISKVIIEDK